MNHFHRVDNALWAEGVPLAEIAREVGTPTYVYSRATFERHFNVVSGAMPSAHRPLICYSVKACPNLAILALLAKMGCGADVVSGGELARALEAGIPPDRMVFSGVGKTATELREALSVGIYAINAESFAELETIDRIAGELSVEARVSLRINPAVDPKTHPKIATGLRDTKFGIPIDEALEGYKLVATLPNLVAHGIDVHIGSQLTQLAPVEQALTDVLALVDQLDADGVRLEFIDVGGGLGIPYDDIVPPSPSEYGALLRRVLAGRDLRLVLEPGRVIAGNAGLLMTSVVRMKTNGGRRFTIIDAGMNDLARPALYNSFHRIEPVGPYPDDATQQLVDVVGPVCENTDVMGRDRWLPLALAEGSLLVVRSAGAYGFSMASNYNSRTRPAEVLVDQDRYAVIRERESYGDLTRGERVPDWV